jgi:hypothetical protein
MMRVNTGKGTAAEGWNARWKYADIATRRYMDGHGITMEDLRREPALDAEVSAVWNEALREWDAKYDAENADRGDEYESRRLG